MLQRMTEQSQKNCAEYGIQNDGSTTRKFLIHEVTSEKLTSFITEISHFKQEGIGTGNIYIYEIYPSLSHAREFVA